MEKKTKQIFVMGAFIVLTLVGYMILPKDEIVINLNDGQEGAIESASEIEMEIEKIYVHIEGAVNSPGVKEVPKGTRVFELVELADGTKEGADISKLNLASVLKDEQKVYVPYVVILEEFEGSSKVGYSSNKTQPHVEYYGQININTAGIEELQMLEGIGPSMAKKIIEYREENGYFNSIEDIKSVSGIGEAKYSKIEEDITI